MDKGVGIGSFVSQIGMALKIRIVRCLGPWTSLESGRRKKKVRGMFIDSK